MSTEEYRTNSDLPFFEFTQQVCSVPDVRAQAVSTLISEIPLPIGVGILSRLLYAPSDNVRTIALFHLASALTWRHNRVSTRTYFTEISEALSSPIGFGDHGCRLRMKVLSAIQDIRIVNEIRDTSQLSISSIQALGSFGDITSLVLLRRAVKETHLYQQAACYLAKWGDTSVIATVPDQGTDPMVSVAKMLAGDVDATARVRDSTHSHNDTLRFAVNELITSVDPHPDRWEAELLKFIELRMQG